MKTNRKIDYLFENMLYCFSTLSFYIPIHIFSANISLSIFLTLLFYYINVLHECNVNVLEEEIRRTNEEIKFIKRFTKI